MRQTKTGSAGKPGYADAPTPEAVKRYLKQFLSDRRAVDILTVVMVAVAARRDFAAALAACGEAVRLGLDGRRLAADGLQPPATAGVGTTFTGYARSAGHELRLAITGKRRR